MGMMLSLPLSVTLCNTFAQHFLVKVVMNPLFVSDVTIHESHAHHSAGSFDNGASQFGSVVDDICTLGLWHFDKLSETSVEQP
jgi:hypothetical protein